MKPVIQFKDCVGRTYGYLKVISEEKSVLSSTSRNNKPRRLWKFECVCGNYVTKSPGDVIGKRVHNCGCKKHSLNPLSIEKHKKKRGLCSIESHLMSTYRFCAKQSDREFELSTNEFHTLVNSNCYYCGEAPFLIRHSSKNKVNGKPLNGIDRVDSSKGYTIDNVVPCCVHCNRAKLDRNVNDFKKWVNKTYKHLLKKQRQTNQNLSE